MGWCLLVQNLTMKRVKHMILSVSATPLSTPCSLSSPWCWTKMLSLRLLCCTQSYTKTFWRYLMNSLLAVLPCDIKKNTLNTACVFSPQGRPLSFKTFLIWVLISIYQGNEEFHWISELVTAAVGGRDSPQWPKKQSNYYLRIMQTYQLDLGRHTASFSVAWYESQRPFFWISWIYYYLRTLFDKRPG